ncbi:MAG: aminotransferase class I/II-fold pyridoxal phosphate-dependent enzyme [Actinobacteria bacterium]|nr:aminotransferase class I/II-fold pyridoxal phosphate-dependent enzyme [Actinomycetota bacterium]
MTLTQAARAAAVPPFHAMAMSRAASEREAAGHEVLHLEVGQPATSAPALARQAAVAAIERGDALGYTNAAGLMSLRRRIARHYREWYQADLDPASIAVVAGASAGFTLAFAAAFDAGDRVGVIEPGYPCYRNTLLALGIEPVAIAVDASTRWAPSVELLEAAGRLDGLIVASPSNPTGTVLSADALGDIAAWCESSAVQLISDEIYHGIVYDGRADTALNWSDSAIVVNSFSKYWSMTGWRLGWMVVPRHLHDTVERLQQNLYICAPHVSQVAGTAAFDCADELDANVARYRANRSVLLSGLAGAGLTDVAPADGAFYVYADVEHLVTQVGGDSMQLCTRWLHELGLACTPGLDFDLQRGTHTVRFSYAGDAADLHRACERIAGWAP